MDETEGQLALRERWLKACHQVTAALLSGEDFAGTLHLVAEQARAVSGASVGAVARPAPDDESTLVFDVIASPDPEHKRLAMLTVPTEGTAAGQAFTSGEPVVVRQYGVYVAAQQGGAVPANVKDLDSAVAVPLVVGSETLGVLLVAKFGDKVPFTDIDVELVRDFAAHAAVTVQFARAEDDRRRLAVLEDRDRIGRDLHDLVIQRLFAIGLGLRELNRPELGRFVQDIDETIRELRNSIFSLQEPAEGGIRSLLLELARESAAALGFEPRVGFDGPLEAAVTGPLRIDVLAAARESLANVARHAAATSVTVEATVDRDGRRFSLTVLDDGIGLPRDPARRSGLANLTSRAARWGGTCSVDPVPGGGTRLTWTAGLR